jgi:hypothetical protein
MPNFAIALLLRPFVLFGLLYAAVKLSHWIRPIVPSKWQSVLYRRIN